MREARENRAERLHERADKARAEADSLALAGSRMADAIPMGQPILIGHHSERRDRAYRAKIGAKFEASSKASDKAEELERRAEAAEHNTAIYADAADPVAELDAKIAKLEARQATMKKCNVLVRKGDRAALLELVHKPETVEELFTPNCFGQIGFPDFELTSNSANIRRLKARRDSLARMKSAGRSERTVGEVRVVEDPDIARIQLFYPGKPDQATRDKLKRNGFRWAPSEGAWQRNLNNAGKYAARQVLGA